MKKKQRDGRLDYVYVSGDGNNQPALILDRAAEVKPGDLVWDPKQQGLFRVGRGKRAEYKLAFDREHFPAIILYRVCAIADTIAGRPINLEKFREQFPFWC